MFRLAEKSLGPEIILDVNMIHVDAMFSTRMQKMTNVSLFSFFLDCPKCRHAESSTNGKSSDDFDRWIAVVKWRPIQISDPNHVKH